MRLIIAQLLAPAICFGLFIVTCPLTAQSTTPAAEQPNCCALSELGSECAVSEQHQEDDSGSCCVTHDCGTVIAAPAAPVLLTRIDAPRLAFHFTQSIAERVQRPLVPPPRPAVG
jgi:hypothetical protein